jgi:hypothetical protein
VVNKELAKILDPPSRVSIVSFSTNAHQITPRSPSLPFPDFLISHPELNYRLNLSTKYEPTCTIRRIS